MGFTSKEASKLRSRSLDISGVRLDKNGEIIKTRIDKHGNTIKDRNYSKVLRTSKAVVNTRIYKEDMDQVKNDTIYSRWGMYTQDKRYRDKTARVVKFIEKDLRATNKQAYYVLYFMQQSGMSYEDVKKQMATDETFEMYQKAKNEKKRVKPRKRKRK
ncbi:MAG: hypothetical protein QXN68_02705 [Thermoplasmata archaeon]